MLPDLCSNRYRDIRTMVGVRRRSKGWHWCSICYPSRSRHFTNRDAIVERDEERVGVSANGRQSHACTRVCTEKTANDFLQFAENGRSAEANQLVRQ